ncbi:MAG TPA: hypothetical protein VGF59_02070, partial [Bryobacteraceae bacterium]
MVVKIGRAPSPRSGLVWLLGASLLVAAALWTVYSAKVQRMGRGELVNLNTVASPGELLPLLESFPDRTERELAAQRTFEFFERARPLRNVGALSALRLSLDEIES